MNNAIERARLPARGRLRVVRIVRSLVVLLLISNLIAAIVLLIKKGPSVPARHQPWSESFGLPYKPRGLF